MNALRSSANKPLQIEEGAEAEANSIAFQDLKVGQPQLKLSQRFSHLNLQSRKVESAAFLDTDVESFCANLGPPRDFFKAEVEPHQPQAQQSNTFLGRSDK